MTPVEHCAINVLLVTLMVEDSPNDANQPLSSHMKVTLTHGKKQIWHLQKIVLQILRRD